MGARPGAGRQYRNDVAPRLSPILAAGVPDASQTDHTRHLSAMSGALTGLLGEVPLRNLTPGLIQSAYCGLLDGGLSKRTVEQTHAVLHRALDQAMHWG